MSIEMGKKDESDPRKRGIEIDESKLSEKFENSEIEFFCTLHKKLKVACDKTCGILNDWAHDHEKCPYRIHKSEVVWGKIFNGKDGWLRTGGNQNNGQTP